MKNFAKLTLFFSLTFASFFLAAILIRIVSSWIDLFRNVSAGGTAEDLAVVIWIAIPAALYFSILFTLAYSARKRMSIPVTIIGITVLAFAFTAGISQGIERVEAVKSDFRPASPIQAGPGLILPRQGGNAIILLKESSDPRGPRLVSFSGQSFIYQETPLGPNNTILRLPTLSFGNEGMPWFLRSIGIDFSISAGELKTRFEDSFFNFVAYAFSLILLLSSLRFLLELSQWPLANIFFGALIFRFILSLEVFVNSPEINALIGSFLADRAPPVMITALVFGAASALVIIYTMLAGIVRTGGSKSKRDQDD